MGNSNSPRTYRSRWLDRRLTKRAWPHAHGKPHDGDDGATMAAALSWQQQGKMGCAQDRAEQGEGTMPTNWTEVDGARGIRRALPWSLKGTDGEGTSNWGSTPAGSSSGSVRRVSRSLVHPRAHAISRIWPTLQTCLGTARRQRNREVRQGWPGAVMAGRGRQLQAQARMDEGEQQDMHKALGCKAITRKPTMAQYCAAVDGVSHGRQQHSVEEPK